MIDTMKNALTALGRPVYAPGQYAGKCAVPYLVVKQSGTYTLPANAHGGYTLYDVFIYVPLTDYSLLETLTADAKRALKGVPNLTYDSESPDLIEFDYGAYSRSIQYHSMTTIDIQEA